jgi:putative nucleotide binding protein
MQKKYEENVIVLDFLVNGYIGDKSPIHLKTPIVQAIGTNNFTLLELVPKKGVFLQIHDTVYIGENKRDKIHHINGKLNYSRLTSTAKAELEHVILDIIKADEPRFISFFNTAQPLNTRIHIIELLPGVGKKHMLEILDKRRDAEFESFVDLKARVKLMPDPEKAITKRIIQELQGLEKHSLFVR